MSDKSEIHSLPAVAVANPPGKWTALYVAGLYATPESFQRIADNHNAALGGERALNEDYWQEVQQLRDQLAAEREKVTQLSGRVAASGNAPTTNQGASAPSQVAFNTFPESEVAKASVSEAEYEWTTQPVIKQDGTEWKGLAYIVQGRIFHGPMNEHVATGLAAEISNEVTQLREQLDAAVEALKRIAERNSEEGAIAEAALAKIEKK